MSSTAPVTAPAPIADPGAEAPATHRAAVVGLGVAVTLMVLAVAVPALLDWNVRVRWWPPLHAEWGPRVGLGTLLALAIAALGTWYAVQRAPALRWRTLLLVAYAGGLAWMVSLATVDGWDGIGQVLEHPYEYLRTARATDDVPAMLQEYVSRISYDAEPRNWPVHLAGHPPGAVLVYIGLVRMGLGGGLAAGLVTTAIAASTALAVMTTLRTLGAEAQARRAAPYLVLGTAAVWQCVSGDAMFAAVGAWGLAALAAAAVSATRGRMLAWCVVAGLLLGYVVMMSYGLPLLGILALAVLWLGQGRRSDTTARPWTVVLPVTATVSALVVLAFAAAGFAYWEALPELHERYWEGVAGRRPPEYWMWGNLAAFAFSAGPMVGAGVGALVARRRLLRAEATETTGLRTAAVLASAGTLTVLVANLSQMSRAEVERIWLPFVPWVLVACALLPERLWRVGLVVQVVTALLVQHLLVTSW